MNKILVANRGQEVKFNVVFHDDNFDRRYDPIEITLRWGLLGRKLIIKRDEMLFDEHHHCFIVIDTSKMTGIVTATCRYEIQDVDMDDERRTEIDEQPLMYVATGRISCCRPICGCKCPPEKGHAVEYRYVHDTNVVQDFYYLITSDEFYMETSDETILSAKKHNTLDYE